MEYDRIRIIRVGSDPVIGFAAKELAKYLKMAEPELVVDELIKPKAQKEEGVLVLAVCPKTQELLQVEDPALDDGYRIEVEDGKGCILGTNERSVLLGVYRYLREIGFGFVRPSKDGERIPKGLPKGKKVSVLEKAAYRHRGICIEGADTYENIYDMVDFLPKVGLNEYFIQFLVPGTFFERWYFHESNPLMQKESLTREDIEAMTRSIEEAIKARGLRYHKTGHGWTCEPFGIDGTTWDRDRVYTFGDETRQYLAEVNGKRDLWGNIPLNTNLCYSNPEVRKKMTDAITEYCAANPFIDVLHFWLADGSNNHCECENCQKKRPSDWYVTLLNELDDKMTARGVKTKVVFLIYVDLLWKPVEVELKHPERFILMFAPITRNYGQNYADSPAYEGELPPYVRNKLKMPASLAENMAHLAEWQKWIAKTATKPLDSFIYDYHLMWPHAVDPGYETAARGMYEDMRYLKEMGLGGNVSCQVQRCFFPTGLVVRGLSAALWDPKPSFEEMADAYYEESFGEDKDVVHSYMKTVSDNFNLYSELYDKKRVSSKDEVYVKDPEAVLESIDMMRSLIEERLAGDPKRAPKVEWELLALHTDYVEKLTEVFVLRQAGKEEEAQEASADMFLWLDENEMKLQKPFDIHNHKRVMTGHFTLKDDRDTDRFKELLINI